MRPDVWHEGCAWRCRNSLEVIDRRLEPVYQSSGERLIGGQCCSHLGLSWGRCIAHREGDHEARMSTKVYHLVTSALLRLDEGLDGVLQ